MSTIAVFEPALCCNTGVCGEDLDQNLVTFTANLANDPLSFAHNETVKKFLELAGSDGLPLVLVDDVTVATGRYPTRTELATWAGLEVPAPPSGVTMLGLADDSDSCCTPGESTCC